MAKIQRLKGKVVELLPAIAVFGVTAAAGYAAFRIIRDTRKMFSDDIDWEGIEDDYMGRVTKENP